MKLRWAPVVAPRGNLEVSRALLDVCRGITPKAPSDRAVAAELVSAARVHRVAPLTHVAYRQVSPELSGCLRADRDQAIAIHLRSTSALNQLSQLLSDLNWVTFKGPVLSERAHPVPGLRTYHDVDVLVAPSDLREACRRLAGAAWRLADYQDMLRNPETPGEMHWISPSGVIIDLHWSLINMAQRRARFTIPTASLLARRTDVMIGRDRVWALDPIDSLIHVCLHAALAGASRLLMLVDVHYLSQQIADWEELASRARAWQVHAQVALVLRRAHRSLDTTLPTDFDRQLSISRTLATIIDLTDRFAPVSRVRRETGLAKFVARAIRPTTRSTVLTSCRHGLVGMRDRTLGANEHTAGRVVADSKALGAYLSTVEQLGANDNCAIQ